MKTWRQKFLGGVGRVNQERKPLNRRIVDAPDGTTQSTLVSSRCHGDRPSGSPRTAAFRKNLCLLVKLSAQESCCRASSVVASGLTQHRAMKIGFGLRSASGESGAES